MRWGWSLPLLLVLPFPAFPADDTSKQDQASKTTDPEIPQHRLLNDTFRLRLGTYYAQTTTEANFTTQNGGAGVDVNFEDLLGVGSRKWVGEAAMYWRMTEHWRVDFDYFSINRGATRTLARDVTWGDFSYSAGTEVNSTTKISDLRAVVGYSFFKRADKELGAGLGLHMTGFAANINATASGSVSGGGGSVSASGGGASSESVSAPLPVASVYGDFALTDTWALSLRTDWLSMNYDKYSGAIRATAVDFVYQPFTHFAFGFGVHSLTLALDVHYSNSQTQVRFVSHGPVAFVAYSY